MDNLHKSSVIVDAHCDTLTILSRQNRCLGEHSSVGHLDLPRLFEGGVNVQFFAAFVAPEFRDWALKRVFAIIDLFYWELENNREHMLLVTDFKGIVKAIKEKKIASILAVEGGEALAGSLEVLRILYKLGVRSITLTWNNRNELADGVEEQGTRGGLTRFGVAVVQEMNRLGMLVDVSHISEQGFWDVLDVSKSPVIASHSNCYSLCEHPRNLTDRQIKAMADKGGVIGICFAPAFICNNGEASVSKLVDHIEYLVNIGGIDCAGLGSDFDGISSTPSGLEDVTRLSNITIELVARGYSEQEIKKILGGNFLRVLEQVL